MKFILFLSCLFCLPSAHAQQEDTIRSLWYNVENLFHFEDDPETDDNEFLPSGNRHWTPGRYYHKLRQLARVITAAGEWDTPALVGLCEVENDSVVAHLLHRTPLRRQQYRYCMGNSADPRGIRTALLYQRDRFALLGHTSIPIRSTGKRRKLSRDILHAWGRIANGDTLDIMLCHFPSRYGGEKETEASRTDAARTLRVLCDSLHHERKTPQLLLMGDFNDTPDDASIREILRAAPLPTMAAIAPATGIVASTSGGAASPDSLTLYNMFASPTTLAYPGSHKYQGEWSQLDQMIICDGLADPSHTMYLLPGSARLFCPAFLLTNDKTWRGVRPKRTYYGYTYEGGFSDHLPLVADWVIRIP